MPAPRLAYALELLGAGDWLEFERFAAEFLAPEYPTLRTTAAPHGDRGRDGQMYCPDEEPNTVVQYSVSADWRDKIGGTLRRLSTTFPDLRQLIYVTNQRVLPDADELVSSVRQENGISVDIRDRSWFTDRELTYEARKVASAELARRFVDPMLTERGVGERVATALDGNEARVALLHLALDAEDAATHKGLTKRAFESLVLASLHDTDTDHRVALSEIQKRVRALLPAGHDEQIDALVVSALERLSRRQSPVRRYGQSPEYHLDHTAQQAMSDHVAAFLAEEGILRAQLAAAAAAAAEKPELTADELGEIGRDLQNCLETVLLQSGESFAMAVLTGEIQQLDPRGVVDAINGIDRRTRGLVDDDQATIAILNVLEEPSVEVRYHLRRLADAYTMYAFLRQTPDVQRVVVKLFAGGDLWLDTTVVLPLFAETLLDDPGQRGYTTILAAARDAGIHLFVTEGILEEVERHLNLSLQCARTQARDWHARFPFVFSAFTMAGRSRGEFYSWLEEFRGVERPVEDVASYLRDIHGIDTCSLTEQVGGAPEGLRAAIQEVWLAVHQRRQELRQEPDPPNLDRLVAHDVETTVGVIQLRRSARSEPMGHQHWLLTLDKTALTIERVLKETFGVGAPHSPVLSPDFMVQYLRLAPVRTAIERELRANLPILTDVSRYESVPRELIDMADGLRSQAAGLDPRIAQRRIRDQLDREKLRRGADGLRGARAAEDAVLAKIAAARSRP